MHAAVVRHGHRNLNLAPFLKASAAPIAAAPLKTVHPIVLYEIIDSSTTRPILVTTPSP